MSSRFLTLAIPNRNGASYIDETFQSLDRNRPWVRWYLQDCCSTDESVGIAGAHAAEADRICVEPDRGQVDALNRAIGNMGGDIIGFLNADDCLADGAAEAVLAEFESHPEADIVYGEVEWIDAQGRSQGFHSGRISSLVEILNIYDVWWGRRQWVQPEVFWRRRLWDRVGPLNESMDLAFDFEYWVRCWSAGAVVRKIPRVLARFRRHEHQKSLRAGEAAQEIRTTVLRALDENPGLGAWSRNRLKARLEYDTYRLGAQNGGFPGVLLRHPLWLAAPEVRARLRRSVSARFGNAGSL
jgi:glycosyltransferase involved in cell wall biosynthesis